MIPRGQVVMYKATVIINPCQLSCQTTFPHPVKAFIQAMTSKLETSGLLLLRYCINKGVMRNQFACQFVLQTMNGFTSKQAIVGVVNTNILQETGNAAINPSDPPPPPLCAGVACVGFCSGGFTICPCACKVVAKVPATSYGGCSKAICYSPQYQAIVKAGGTGACVCACLIPCAGKKTIAQASNAAQATTQAIGNFFANAWNGFKNALPNTSTWILVGAVVLGIALLFTYTYGKAGGRLA